METMTFGFYIFHLLNIFLIVFAAVFAYDRYMEYKLKDLDMGQDIVFSIDEDGIKFFNNIESDLDFSDSNEEDKEEHSDSKSKQDNVNHPKHYNKFSQEVIVTIGEWLNGYEDGYVAYCIGNTLKYLSRAPYKHETPLEDLKKAQWYLNEAIEIAERGGLDE